VLWYFNTGAPPSEEWAEDLLHDGEVYSFYTVEMDFGGDLILSALVFR
jgi:hypothetical protein